MADMITGGRPMNCFAYGATLLSLWTMPHASGTDSVQISENQDHGRPPDIGSDGYLHSLNQQPLEMVNYNFTNMTALTPEQRLPVLALCQNLSSPSGQPISNFECICRLSTCVKTMDDGCRNFEFVVSFVLVGITCLFGLIGNVLSILTLRRDSIKSVTTFLLSALAVADFAFLIPAVFVIMIPTYCEFYQHCAKNLILVIPHFEQFGWAIASTTHSCTVYVTVLVAIHRYLWVCRPGLAQKLSGLGRAKVQVAIVPLCALIYNSPRFFEYQVRKVVYKSNNGTEIRAETIKELNKVGSNTYFQYFYKNVCFFIIMYLIPLTILVMVSVNLIRTLKQRRATLQRIGSTNSNASQNRRDDNITFVLIIIIAAFIVCQTPTMLQRLLLAMAGDTGHTCPHPYFYMEHIADYMALLNSSTNFVIYILFSPHFRRTLISEVLCKGNKPSRASTALRHFSRISKSKKPSDEKNATLIGRDTRPGENYDTSPGHNGRMTGNGRGSSQQLANGQVVGVQWLTPPDGMDNSGRGSTSHSTQMTSHEFLTTSQADIEDGDLRDHGIGTLQQICDRDTDDRRQDDIDIGNCPDEEKEIEIPLIAFERASSVVDTS